MRRYKVDHTNKERKKPSKEAIEKYKDFSRLSHEYDRMVQRPKVPIYKDKQMFLVLLLIVLIAFILSQLNEDKKSTEPTQNDGPKQTTEQVVD